MHYEPQDGTWQIGEAATLLAELRQRMTPEAYEHEKQALMEFLCGYFSTGECRNALGSSISPMKASPGGGKVLKVCWAYPGCGKSGRLRWSSLPTVARNASTSPRRSIAERIRWTKTSQTLSAICRV